MPRPLGLSYRKHGGRKNPKKRGDSLKSKLNNIKEQESKLKHHESSKSASSSTKSNGAKEPTILGRINIISERKGDSNFPLVENSTTSLNENEDIAHHQSDLQHSTREDREQEHIKSRILEVDNFISCSENGENDQPIFIDVDNKEDYIANQHCGSASQNSKERQIREENNKSHILGLEKVTCYLENTKNDLGNNEKDYITGQHCENTSQNTKERQIQETKSESLEKCTPYLGNNEKDYSTGQHYGNSSDNAKERQIQEEKKNSVNNLRNNENAKEKQNNRLIIDYDAIDLLFLGLAESVKSFSSERQANIKLKVANLVLEQEVQQRKEDSKLSRSSSKSLM